MSARVSPACWLVLCNPWLGGLKSWDDMFKDPHIWAANKATPDYWRSDDWAYRSNTQESSELLERLRKLLDQHSIIFQTSSTVYLKKPTLEAPQRRTKTFVPAQFAKILDGDKGFKWGQPSGSSQSWWIPMVVTWSSSCFLRPGMQTLSNPLRSFSGMPHSKGSPYPQRKSFCKRFLLFECNSVCFLQEIRKIRRKSIAHGQAPKLSGFSGFIRIDGFQSARPSGLPCAQKIPWRRMCLGGPGASESGGPGGEVCFGAPSGGAFEILEVWVHQVIGDLTFCSKRRIWQTSMKFMWKMGAAAGMRTWCNPIQKGFLIGLLRKRFQYLKDGDQHGGNADSNRPAVLFQHVNTLQPMAGGYVGYVGYVSGFYYLQCFYFSSLVWHEGEDMSQGRRKSPLSGEVGLDFLQKSSKILLKYDECQSPTKPWSFFFYYKALLERAQRLIWNDS